MVNIFLTINININWEISNNRLELSELFVVLDKIVINPQQRNLNVFWTKFIGVT